MEYFLTVLASFLGTVLGLKFYYSTTVEVEYPLEPPSADPLRHKPIRVAKRRRPISEVQEETIQSYNDWMYHKPSQME